MRAAKQIYIHSNGVKIVVKMFQITICLVKREAVGTNKRFVAQWQSGREQ